jgi:hypothetical protein
MEKIQIQGKDYITVNERLKEFRENETYNGWALITKIIELNEKVAVFQAEIFNEKSILMATGTAREVNGDSFINKTSYVENAETSAWGRALGNLGIGIDTNIATYEEIENAKLNQNKQQSNTENSYKKPEYAKKPASKEKKAEGDNCPDCEKPVNILQYKDKTTGELKPYWKCKNCGLAGWHIKTEEEIKSEKLDAEIPF